RRTKLHLDVRRPHAWPGTQVVQHGDLRQPGKTGRAPKPAQRQALKAGDFDHDLIGLNRITISFLRLSMIFSENRYPVFSGSCSRGNKKEFSQMAKLPLIVFDVNE